MHYYKVKNVTTNTQDSNLLNPHDFVIQKCQTVSGQPEVWVANEKSGTVTHYDLDGNLLPYTNLTVPAVLLGAMGSPTGIVYNSTNNFAITQNGLSAKSILIVCTRDGQILGWNPAVNATEFVPAYTDGNGAVYTGLELVDQTLYATDFHGNKVDVFNNIFALQDPLNYPFTNPAPPPFYYPYNIAQIDALLVVTYALNSGDLPVKGPGFGIANEFDYNGNLIRRLVNNGDTLNAPYGLANVHDYFARPAHNSMFFGNFGD